MEKERRWRVIEAGIMVLFTLQAIRALFSMLFAYIYEVAMGPGAAPVLWLAFALIVASGLLPLLSPRAPRRLRSNMRIAAIICATARIPMTIDHPALRLLSSILVLAGAWLYLTGLLRSRPWMVPAALSAGLLADQLLRALGHTFDPSLRLVWLPAQILLSVAAVYLAGAPTQERGSGGMDERAGFAAGLSLGAALFMLASLLALSNAATGWTGGHYAVTVAWMMALTGLPLWPAALRVAAPGGSMGQRLILALLVPIGIGIAYQGRPVISSLSLAIALAALWVLLPYSLTAGRRGTRLGAVAGFGALFLLAILHALSFTYAYTLAAFEGLGLPTFLAASILAVAPALLPDAGQELPRALFPTGGSPRWPLLGLTMWVLAVIWALPRPLQLEPAGESIRLGTYNIHYGFDTHRHLSLEAQARTIRESGAHVVALQEVDTGRLTSYGIDNARWLARRLGMEVVYLPTVEHSTGIALLSRVPIRNTQGTLLPSHEEPTGIVGVTVDVGGVPLRAYGIWLGLTPEERARQLSTALRFMNGGHAPENGRATLAGDLNATPGSNVYETLEHAGFIDPFIAGGFDPAPTHPAISPEVRIDYVWLRGMEPLGARVLDSIASDHRMVVVEAR